MDKICAFCGESFVSKRKTAIYCCQNHRVLAFNRAKNDVLKSVNLDAPKKIFRQDSALLMDGLPTNQKVELLAKSVGCKVASEVPSPVRTAESLANERLGASVANFCNENNCTWDDVKGGYLASLKPIKAKVKTEKAEEKVQQNSKTTSGGYNRFAIKMGKTS